MNPQEHTTPLDRAWAVLTVPHRHEFESYPLDIAFVDLACRVGIDRAGMRHLLIPAAGETLSQDSRSSVLSSATRALTFAGKTANYIDIWCTEADLNDEFNEVIGDILYDIEGVERPGSVALTNLARWRRLFKNRLVRGLSEQARRGLFAELTVLLALIDADAHTSVDAWTGPFGQPHDFETDNRSIEVKAVTSSSESITVNGLDQLDTQDDRPLDLVVLTVVTDPAGTTLTDLIHKIRARIDHPSGLDQRLTRLGWQRSAADTESYTVAEVQRVPITESTPRLVPASLASAALPDGVSDVTYRVTREALAACSTGDPLSRVAADAVR